MPSRVRTRFVAPKLSMPTTNASAWKAGATAVI
jgi:hypothetical protein